MSDLLRSMKSDLLSRRMLPLLAVAIVALIAAIAYASLAGSAPKLKATSSPAPIAKASGPEGPAVSSAPGNPNSAVAETTSGVPYQHGGTMHNPFAALPGSGSSAGASAGTGAGASSALVSSATSSSSSSSSSSSEGTSKGVPGSSGTSSPPPGETSGSSSSKANGAPSGSSDSDGPQGSGAPTEIYEVNATWQPLSSSGTPSGAPVVHLNGIYERLAELPSTQHPLFAYAGVSRDTRKAAFVLLVPPILHGEAKCLPGPNNCEMIALEAKQSEEMQYLQPDGKVVAYELTLDSIAKRSLSANAAKSKANAVSKAGKRLLEQLHLTLPDGVSFARSQDVLLGVGSLLARSAKAHH